MIQSGIYITAKVRSTCGHLTYIFLVLFLHNHASDSDQRCTFASAQMLNEGISQRTGLFQNDVVRVLSPSHWPKFASFRYNNFWKFIIFDLRGHWTDRCGCWNSDIDYYERGNFLTFGTTIFENSSFLTYMDNMCTKRQLKTLQIHKFDMNKYNC